MGKVDIKKPNYRTAGKQAAFEILTAAVDAAVNGASSTQLRLFGGIRIAAQCPCTPAFLSGLINFSSSGVHYQDVATGCIDAINKRSQDAFLFYPRAFFEDAGHYEVDSDDWYNYKTSIYRGGALRGMIQNTQGGRFIVTVRVLDEFFRYDTSECVFIEEKIMYAIAKTLCFLAPNDKVLKTGFDLAIADQVANALYPKQEQRRLKVLEEGLETRYEKYRAGTLYHWPLWQNWLHGCKNDIIKAITDELRYSQVEH